MKSSSAHTDLTMDTPDGQFDTLCVQRLFPGKDVLVNAVYERTVEVKEENWLDTHCLSLAENVSVAMEVHQSSNQPSLDEKVRQTYA